MNIIDNSLNPKFKAFVDHIAYLSDSFRVFPRLILLFWFWIGVEVTEWFTAMNGNDITAGVGGLVTGIFASLAAYGKFYVESGPRTPRQVAVAQQLNKEASND